MPGRAEIVREAVVVLEQAPSGDVAGQVARVEARTREADRAHVAAEPEVAA